MVAWAIVATAIILMDSIGAGNFREQAKRDLHAYQMRLDALADQRDMRSAEALAAQERFNAALDQISVMQSELLASETRRHELETGIEVIQSNLRDTVKEREAARVALADLESQVETGVGAATASAPAAQLDLVAAALARTAAERDKVISNAQDALIAADDMAMELALLRDQNNQIFRQLEEAMAISVKPLDKMFSAAGFDTDRILSQIRRGYSGQDRKSVV